MPRLWFRLRLHNKEDTREAIFEFGKNRIFIKHGTKKEDFTPRFNEKLKLLIKDN